MLFQPHQSFQLLLRSLNRNRRVVVEIFVIMLAIHYFLCPLFVYVNDVLFASTGCKSLFSLLLRNKYLNKSEEYVSDLCNFFGLLFISILFLANWYIGASEVRPVLSPLETSGATFTSLFSKVLLANSGYDSVVAFVSQNVL